MAPDMSPLEAIRELQQQVAQTQAVRHRAWDELDIVEKVERMRSVVKDLQHGVARLAEEVRKDLADLKQHTHGPSGAPAIPLSVLPYYISSQEKTASASDKPWF